MHKERQKINGIICEIVVLLLEEKATDISIIITESGMGTKIEISSEQVVLDKDTMNKIDKLFNTQRTAEIEFPYWELVGNVRDHSNLHLVGNMVDKAETYYHNNSFQIVLYRKFI